MVLPVLYNWIVLICRCLGGHRAGAAAKGPQHLWRGGGTGHPGTHQHHLSPSDTACTTRSCFPDLQEQHIVLWLSLDYLCDALYLLDIAVHLHTGRCLRPGMPQPPHPGPTACPTPPPHLAAIAHANAHSPVCTDVFVCTHSYVQTAMHHVHMYVHAHVYMNAHNTYAAIHTSGHRVHTHAHPPPHTHPGHGCHPISQPSKGGGGPGWVLWGPSTHR